MHRHAVSTLLMLVLLGAITFAQSAQAPREPSPGARAMREMFDFLLGSWEGEGSGEPGQGTGAFVFETSLGGNLISRRSHTEYPAKGRPAATHEDFMIVYGERGQVRADYVDNEGHVIHYTVSYTPQSATVTFVTPVVEGQSRYRLVYRPLSTDRVEVTFEMAPPEKPTTFGRYLKGVARRTR